MNNLLKSYALEAKKYAEADPSLSETEKLDLCLEKFTELITNSMLFLPQPLQSVEYTRGFFDYRSALCEYFGDDDEETT